MTKQFFDLKTRKQNIMNYFDFHGKSFYVYLMN